MCGIAGIFNLSEAVHPDTLQRFTDSLKHRGPDAAGYTILAEGKLGLGHRRLSILDLSDRANQPMSYANGRFTIVYNGEIYNFMELRQELENNGHCFKTNTDTEVILAAYLEWGNGCFNRFNGMWALAIWDDKNKELLLARDRFGIKPLYFMLLPGRIFAFASETIAFKNLDGYSRTLNHRLTDLAMVDDYCLEGLGYTIFSDIKQILPAHLAVFTGKSNELRQERWWSIEKSIASRTKMSFKEAADEFEELLLSACRYRLISDVPLATALSGGLDSSCVFAAVHKVLDENPSRVNENSQKAVSAIFPGLINDEREYVELMLQHTGKQAIWVSTDEDNLERDIEHDTRMLDAISSSPITSIAAIYSGMKKAGISVSLDGHGVDEMMYGYKNMVAALYQYYLWQGDVKDTQAAGDTLVNMYHPDDQNRGWHKIQAQIGLKKKRESSLFYRLKKVLHTKSNFDKGFLPLNLPVIGDAYNFTAQPFEYRMLLHETFQHTLPALFRNFDRASMMNGVEIRMPFMDYRIVEFLFSLPSDYKFGSGKTKLLLREAMKKYLPEAIANRTFKVGIASPSEAWFNGKLHDWLMDQTKGMTVRQALENEKREKGKISRKLLNQAWKEVNLKLISS